MSDELEQARWNATVLAKLEHIEKSQADQASAIDHLSGKVDGLIKEGIASSIRMEQIGDLERRVKELEKQKWMLVGVLTVVAFVAPFIVQMFD